MSREIKLITVVIPVYNTEEYLMCCINSVINQTYNNLEIILVDDGANDMSSYLCDDWITTDPRITVIHKKNGGLSDARNTGLDYSSGDYIMFVDSDDFILDRMAEDLYDAIIRGKCDLVECGIFRLFSNNTLVCRYLSDSIIPKEAFLEKILTEEDLSTYVVNKLYNRQLFDGLRFEKGKLFEDKYIMHYIGARCRSVSTLRNCYYYYIQRRGSLTDSNNVKKEIHWIEAQIDCLKYYISLGYFKSIGKTYCHIAVLYSELFNNSIEQYSEDIKFIYGFLINNYNLMRFCSVREKLHILLILFNPVFYQSLKRIIHFNQLIQEKKQWD